ncbi:MAG: hypothetical protein AAGE52_39160 [Myxococcota bacterium]
MRWLAILSFLACSQSSSVTTSLCDEMYDPDSRACPDVPTISLEAALAVARTEPEVGDAALLRATHRTREVAIDLDGNAGVWTFHFLSAEGPIAFDVSAAGRSVRSSSGLDVESCASGEGIEGLSSRVALHEAIAAYEDNVGPFVVDGQTQLRLVLNHACTPFAGLPPEQLRHVRIDRAEGVWFAFLDQAGDVREWRGPARRPRFFRAARAR